MHDQFLKRIPTNLAEFFPYLIAIELKDTHLIAISSNDLRPFPNLEIFISYHNNLVSLDGDLFKFTQKLRIISFYDNYIQKVGEDLLKNLTNLEHANFDKNPCTTLQAGNPDDMIELKVWLPIECPNILEAQDIPALMDANSPKKLHDRNFELLDFLIKQNEKLVLEIEQLKSMVYEQNEVILELDEMNQKLELRVKQLESRLDENPTKTTQAFQNFLNNVCQMRLFKNICQMFS